MSSVDLLTLRIRQLERRKEDLAAAAQPWPNGSTEGE